jgi:hypothetical protein
MPKPVTQVTRRARTIATAVACVVGPRAGQALAQPVVDQVRTALQANHAAASKRTWNDARVNTLAPGRLVQLLDHSWNPIGRASYGAGSLTRWIVR